MARTSLIAWAAGAIAATLATAAPAQVAVLAGKWVNVAPQLGGLAALDITLRTRTPTSPVVVETFAQCSPKPCDWGLSEATGYNQSINGAPVLGAFALSVTYQQPSAQRLLILTQMPGDQLQYQLYTSYPRSAALGYVITGVLRRDTTPLHMAPAH
jgi:hypothetical protein